MKSIDRMISLLVALAVVASLHALITAPAHAQPPNIVVFLVDDMGWQETSVPFYYQDGVAQTTALNEPISYTQHGTASGAGDDVYGGPCPSHVFADPRKPDDRPESSSASRDFLDEESQRNYRR